MNKKKILFAILVLILIIIIGVLIYKKNNSQKEENLQNEITPLEEMTEEQERQTMISLYFIDTRK